MIRKKGKVKYVPPRVLEEVESINKEYGYNKTSQGFEKMVEHCRTGREMDKIRDRFFLKDLLNKKKRRK